MAAAPERDLELDWICVTMGCRPATGAPVQAVSCLSRDGWTTIHKADRKRYLLNAYRVRLTRARQGMVIFVPPGDDADPTRPPAFYDDTYEYLSSLGVAEA